MPIGGLIPSLPIGGLNEYFPYGLLKCLLVAKFHLPIGG